jgi:DNA-binding transcriptional regulator YiaG
VTKISTQLARWRKEKNLTQKRAAELLKTPLTTYLNWEYGRRKPNATAMSLINENTKTK